MTACYTYEVLVAMIHPVRAKPGDLLRVRPGHRTAPIRVWRRVRGRWRAIRTGPPNYGALLVRADEQVIRQLTAVGVLALRHAA